jgi:hypothetical protein
MAWQSIAWQYQEISMAKEMAKMANNGIEMAK